MAVSAKGYDMAEPIVKKPLKPRADTFEPSQEDLDELRAARERRAAGLTPPSKTQGPAPTTKTTMGRLFQKGGFVRSADGIATKGKTRGRMC